jgi:hypothetical protein
MARSTIRVDHAHPRDNVRRRRVTGGSSRSECPSPYGLRSYSSCFGVLSVGNRWQRGQVGLFVHHEVAEHRGRRSPRRRVRHLQQSAQPEHCGHCRHAMHYVVYEIVGGEN